jgi:hypothetical protein
MVLKADPEEITLLYYHGARLTLESIANCLGKSRVGDFR